MSLISKLRDLKRVGNKMARVVVPRANTKDELRNCLTYLMTGPHASGDLWGPLILCLVLAMSSSLFPLDSHSLLSQSGGHESATQKEQDDQSALVFAAVFVIVWCGAAVVTLNSKLLGGNVCANVHPPFLTEQFFLPKHMRSWLLRVSLNTCCHRLLLRRILRQGCSPIILRAVWMRRVWDFVVNERSFASHSLLIPQRRWVFWRRLLRRREELSLHILCGSFTS
jgi:hypothetical protein